MGMMYKEDLFHEKDKLELIRTNTRITDHYDTTGDRYSNHRSKDYMTSSACCKEEEEDEELGKIKRMGQSSVARLPLSPFDCNIRVHAKKSRKIEEPHLGLTFKELHCDIHDHKCNKFVRNIELPKQVKVIETQFDHVKGRDNHVKNVELCEERVENRESDNLIATEKLVILEQIPSLDDRNDDGDGNDDITFDEKALHTLTEKATLPTSKSHIVQEEQKSQGNKTLTDTSIEDVDNSDLVKKTLHIRRKQERLSRTKSDVGEVGRLSQSIKLNNRYANGIDQNNNIVYNNESQYVISKRNDEKEEHEKKFMLNNTFDENQEDFFDNNFNYKNYIRRTRSNPSRSKSTVGQNDPRPLRIKSEGDSCIFSSSSESNESNKNSNSEDMSILPNCSFYDHKRDKYVYDINLKKQVDSIRSKFKGHKNEPDNSYRENRQCEDNISYEMSDKHNYTLDKGPTGEGSRRSKYHALSNTGKEYEAFLNCMKLGKSDQLSGEKKKVKKIHCKYGEPVTKDVKNFDFIVVGKIDDYDDRIHHSRSKMICLPCTDDYKVKEKVEKESSYNNVKDSIDRQISREIDILNSSVSDHFDNLTNHGYSSRIKSLSLDGEICSQSDSLKKITISEKEDSTCSNENVTISSPNDETCNETPVDPTKEGPFPDIFIRRPSFDRKYNEFHETVDFLNNSIEEFISSLSNPNDSK